MPWESTLSTTVPASGLRATMIGSFAGSGRPAALVVAASRTEDATSATEEEDSATAASAARTAAAVGEIALASAEDLGVRFDFPLPPFELRSTSSASDHGPPTGHPQARVVVCDVIGSSSELKVRKPIVRLVAVDVVDMLVGSERAPKMSFHDDAMLQSVDSSSRELHIAVPSDSSSDEARAARARAEAHGG